MKLTIPGDPIAQMRPRFAKRGKFVTTYDPQAQQKEAIRIYLNHAVKLLFEQGSDEDIKEADLLSHCDSFEVDLTFYMPIRESCAKSEANAKSWGFVDHISKPDGDNLEKAALDMLSGIAYKDDAKIVTCTWRKLYSLNPRTEITIMPHQKLVLTDLTKRIITEFDPKQLRDFFDDCKELSSMVVPSDRRDCADPREIFFESSAALLEIFAIKWNKILKKIEKHSNENSNLRQSQYLMPKKDKKQALQEFLDKGNL